MQKKLLVLFISLSLLGVITLGYNTYFDKNEDIINNIENNNNSNSLAIMVEGTSGYEVWSQNTWPTDGYEFNDVLSKCENGSQISFQDGSVIIKGNVSDKCYVYFDKKPLPVFADVIKNLIPEGATEIASGTDGKLYYHSKDLVDGAGDDSYRYAGNNPYNFVCFGAGAEKYYSGESQTCPDANLYRIIGAFKNGEQYQVKLIKSEYITSAELGIAKNGTPSTNSNYTPLKRVKELPSDGFYWNTEQYTNKDNWYNLWEYDGQKATLNEALNKVVESPSDEDKNGYLGNLGTEWAEKIVETTWHIGGNTTYSVTPKAMYDAEMNAEGTGATYKAPQTTSQAKIGLMYVSDYGYAAENVNNLWTKNIGSYNVNDNRQNNWMYNGVNEWTISRSSDHSSNAFHVNFSGNVSNLSVYSHPYGVRPVFYLKSVTKLKLGESADGSQAHPYMVD